MLEKPNLQDEKIIACLRNGYGVPAARIDFLPIGNDSNAWVYRVRMDGKLHQSRRGWTCKTNMEEHCMTTRASATFEIKAWDEKPYDEFEGGRKLTRASVRKSFQGDIEGDSSLEYLMSYGEDGSASFVGMERIVGRVGNRSGSFVLQHSGTFAGGIAKAAWFVVPGSGTGELSGLRGEGGFAAGHEQQYAVTLDYEFE